MLETYVIQRAGSQTRTVRVAFSSFPDGDTHCVIADRTQVGSEPVLVVHSLYPNQNEQLVRLLLLIDLLRDLGVTEISVFCPYLPYSRQDKRHVAGEALGMHTVCRMLAVAGCARLYVIDCHFMRGTSQGLYEGLSIINVPATELLLDICRDTYMGSAPYHVVGPDKGARLLANGKVDQHMHKTRGDYGASGTTHRDIKDVSAGHILLQHDAAVVVDDMVSTGTTMLRAVQALRHKGSGRVYCVCTHGLFLGDSLAQLVQATDGIIAGDTVPNPASQPITQTLLREVVLPDWLV